MTEGREHTSNQLGEDNRRQREEQLLPLDDEERSERVTAGLERGETEANRGDSDALPSWSRYQVMAVTGTRKLPSSTMVGRRMMFPVRYMAPRAAAQRASPISSTAHQRGAHACPLTFFSARALACRLFTI